MLGLVTTVISVIAGAITFTGFHTSEMPNPLNVQSGGNEVGDSYLRIAVALNGGFPNSHYTGPTQADGTAPCVSAWNKDYQYIGYARCHNDMYIPSGSFIDILVEQDRYYANGQQAPFLQLLGRKDAICIAFITQQWADGRQLGWLGDTGRACGRPWYHSNIIMGDTDHSPDCTWLDENHTGGPEVPVAMQINMIAYNNATEKYNHDVDFYCSSDAIMFKTKFDKTWDPDGKVLWNPQMATKGDNGARSLPDTTADNELPSHHTKVRRSGSSVFAHLIASHMSHHSAIKLCEDDLSHGPDFVSLVENVFCDMALKEYYPLCERKSDKVDCYDFETHNLMTAGGAVARNYSHVETWTGDVATA